jgi:hypothetical protein
MRMEGHGGNPFHACSDLPDSSQLGCPPPRFPMTASNRPNAQARSSASAQMKTRAQNAASQIAPIRSALGIGSSTH